MQEAASRKVINYLDLRKLVSDLENLVRSIEREDINLQKAFMEKWWG